MADYVDNGLRALIKSLRDVVLPSVDHADPLAREQLALGIDYLDFIRKRLDHLVPQARLELDHQVAMAKAVIKLDNASEASRELVIQMESAARVSEDSSASPSRLRAATEAVASAINSLVSHAAHAEPAVRSAIEQVVLQRSAGWIEFERAWYEPLAVDPEAADLPSFDHYFGNSTRSESRGQQ